MRGDLRDEFQFVTHVVEAIGKLAAQHGATLPRGDRIDEFAEQYYDALEVQLAIDGPISIDELQEDLGMDEDDIDARTNGTGYLHQRGVVYPQRSENRGQYWFLLVASRNVQMSHQKYSRMQRYLGTRSYADDPP